MKNISVLIKPSSSLCNLRCKYCFYEDISNTREIKSYGMMNQETMISLIDHIYADLDDGDGVTFGFQGGEPTLVGLAYYERFIRHIQTKDKQIKVSYTIQTNGMFIDRKWCLFLKEHNFLVGLSIDATEKLHDQNRIDAEGSGTFHQVIKTKELFDHFAIEYNVLSVLTEQMANKPFLTFDFLVKYKIKYVQFIPCLDKLDQQLNLFSLKPKSFAKFYKKIFDLWKAEFEQGNYISIKLFDDVANLINFGHIGACGLTGRCQIQHVIEADGSVYPCDFFAIDQFNMGNIRDCTLKQMYQGSQVPAEFINQRTTLPLICQKCNFYQLCGGGCRRMEKHMYVEEKSNYCGYQDFLSVCIEYFRTLRG